MFLQTNIVSWGSSKSSVNFPGTKTMYQVNIEAFPSMENLNKSPKMIKVETESTNMNVTDFLAELPPYTKFRFELIAKSKWALSHHKTSKYFFTSGAPASEPRYFRAFWFPVEKVGISFELYCKIVRDVWQPRKKFHQSYLLYLNSRTYQETQQRLA